MKKFSLPIALILSLVVLVLAVPVVFAAPVAEHGQPAVPAGNDFQHRHPVLLEGRVKEVSAQGFLLQHDHKVFNIVVSNETVYIGPEHWKPAVNDQVQVLALKGQNEQLNALVVRLLKPEPVRIEFRALVETVPNTPGYVGTWTLKPIATDTAVPEAIEVTPRTQISPPNLTPMSGDPIWVSAVKDNNTVIAEKIKIERRTEDGVRVEFRGKIEVFSMDLPSDWVIGGITVTVTSDTVIMGTPADGAMAQVEARARVTDDHRTLTATKIVILPEREQLIELRGVVQAVADDMTSITLAGIEIKLNSETRISGHPKPGVIARVEMVAQTDGFLARSVRVERRRGDESKVMLRGIITGKEDTQLVFSGIEVLLTTETKYHGTPEVGLWAVVQANLTTDDAGNYRLSATQVHVEQHAQDD